MHQWQSEHYLGSVATPARSSKGFASILQVIAQKCQVFFLAQKMSVHQSSDCRLRSLEHVLELHCQQLNR